MANNKDLDLFVNLVNKVQKENEEKFIRIGETEIPIERFTREDFCEEEQEELFGFPEYYVANSQEMVTRKSEGLMVSDASKVPINFGLTTKDKLKIVGGVVLATIVGIGILKFSSIRDEKTFSGDGYDQYTKYIDYARENGLAVSEEGFNEFMGYDYDSNTISIEGNTKGGR